MIGASAASDTGGAERVSRPAGPMTQAEYARRRGVSRQYVSKLVKSGTIRLEPDGLLDPAKADAAIRRVADPSRSLGQPQTNRLEERYDDYQATPTARAVSPSGDRPTFHEIKSVTEALRAKKLRREEAEAEGRLVPKTEVQRDGFEAARQTRNRVLALPMALAGRLVTMTNEREIAALLRDELTRALQLAATDVRSGANPAPTDDDGL